MYDSESSFDLTCNDMRDAFYFIINKICIYIYIYIRKFVMHFISFCSKLRVHVQSIRIPMNTTCAPLSIELQGRRRRSGRTASAGPLFWTSMLSAVSLFSCFGSFFFDFHFIDAIINKARCACHP